MKLHEMLQLLIAVTIPLVAAIWYLADIKSQIIKYIDTIIASLHNRIYDNDKKFEVFVTRFDERKEMVDYRLNGLHEKIDHKFNRLNDDIKSLEEEIKKLK